MNKKLMAVAVAGALAAPGVAFAQASTVTISGIFKVGLESISYSSASSSRLNASQMRVVDNSSRIIFGVVESLGNGLNAVAQLDVRFAPDQGTNLISAATGSAGNPIGSGNTWVGLQSNTWGMLTLGRWDLHYGKQPDDTAAKAGALEAAAISLMDYVQAAGRHVAVGEGAGTTANPNINALNVPIANATRTQNVVKWDSPTWNGFNGTIAWSANAANAPGGEADMTAPAGTASNRRGDAWNINPQYTNGPFQIGYSYWRSKPDAAAPIALSTAGALSGSLDERGDVVYGYYQFGGFKVGLAWNKSKVEAATTSTTIAGGTISGGTLVAERTAWTLPLSYNWGPHTVVGHYTRAGNIKTGISGATTEDTGARMWAIAYVYELSKRTSLGLTYAKINNDDNANYNFFTSNSLGSQDTSVLAGESPRLIQATVRHAF